MREFGDAFTGLITAVISGLARWMVSVEVSVPWLPDVSDTRRLIAYSPLARAQRMGHPTLAAVAARHGVSDAQVLVRWSMQHGYVPLPKSVKAERIAQNVDVFHFELSAEDMLARALSPSPWQKSDPALAL